MIITAAQRESIVIAFPANASNVNTYLAIKRLSDGFYLDFTGMTFKGAGWTTKYGGMGVQDAEFVSTYLWTLPESKETYQVLFKDAAGFISSGPIIRTNGNIMFTVQADAGNSTTVMKTDLTNAATDFYQSPSMVKFFSGSNAEQARKLGTSGTYNGTTKQITVLSAYANAVAANDIGMIITE